MCREKEREGRRKEEGRWNEGQRVKKKKKIPTQCKSI
jgi:hypothetical protein